MNISEGARAPLRFVVSYRQLARSVLLLSLGVPISHSWAQTAKYTDFRAPILVFQWVEGSTAFKTLQEAFDSQQQLFAGWNGTDCKQTAPSSCWGLLTGLHVCPSNTSFSFGKPDNWCAVAQHNWTFGGQSGTDTSERLIASNLWICEKGYTPTNSWFEPAGSQNRIFACTAIRDAEPKKPECTTGDSMLPQTGQKRHVEIDYQAGGRMLAFRREYSSATGNYSIGVSSEFLPPGTAVIEPAACRLGIATAFGKDFDGCFPRMNVAGNTSANAVDDKQAMRSFVSADGGVTWSSGSADFSDRMQAVSIGGVQHWMWSRRNLNEVEVWNTAGQLVTRQRVGDGAKLQYGYSASTGYLASITDEFGRSITVTTDSVNGQPTLRSITIPGGDVIQYSYGQPGRLSSVTFADQSRKDYLWDESALSTGTAGIGRLTGIRDESQARYASFQYLNGLATSTEHGVGIDKFTISDQRSNGAGHVLTTYPTGAVYDTTYAVVGGYSRAVSTTQPAGAGCPAASSATTYDSVGNTTSRIDVNGFKTCYAYNGANQESARVEGLSATADCASALAGATLPSGSRKVTTQWHADWTMVMKVAEPRHLTTSVYNGQPDPFNSGAISSCAPASATLPDGKPIAVLCKKVEQATTDADGAQGFSATLEGGVANRVWQFTYNANGQMLTSKDSLNNTITNTYYADTTADHTKGDLQQVQNAKGHTTQYTKYNAHGQALRVLDPNGVATDYVYDARQRLKAVSVGGQTTTYDYWPNGLSKQATQPDGSFIGYEYDDAQRLKAIKDNLGNRIEYTLDNAGVRTQEVVKDPAGALRRQVSRVPDALGRIQQTTGRE